METAVAEEKKETIITDQDLQQKLAGIRTERKTPGVNSIKKDDFKSFWEKSEDDFNFPKPEKKEKPVETETEEKEPERKGKGLSEAIKQGSAQTAVGTLSFINRVVFTKIQDSKLKKKYEKRFTDEQRTAIEERLIDIEVDEIEDKKEKALKNRFENMMKKYKEKTDAIPFTDKEEKNLHRAFYNWMDITGKEIPPGVWVGLEIANVFGQRAVDAFTD